MEFVNYGHHCGERAYVRVPEVAYVHREYTPRVAVRVVEPQPQREVIVVRQQPRRAVYAAPVVYWNDSRYLY